MQQGSCADALTSCGAGCAPSHLQAHILHLQGGAEVEGLHGPWRLAIVAETAQHRQLTAQQVGAQVNTLGERQQAQVSGGAARIEGNAAGDVLQGDSSRDNGTSQAKVNIAFPTLQGQAAAGRRGFRRQQELQFGQQTCCGALVLPRPAWRLTAGLTTPRR